MPDLRPYAPTIIVVHPRESLKKCSVTPLRKRPDFRFFTFPDAVTVDLSNYVQVGIGGPPLSSADAERDLLFLDASWRLLLKMAPAYQAIPIRSLPPVVTAYPRKSMVFADPSEGLATIEAVYAAFRVLGRPTSGLLDDYYWGERFLELNGWQEA